MKNRKNKLINLSKIGVLLFGVSLFLWNCDNEDILTQEEQKQEKTLIKEIKNVTFNNSITNTIINTSAKGNYKNNPEKNIIYNFNNIIKTIDTLGNIKYSILFQLKNQPKNVLYNLITGESEDKKPITPYVMKYTISNLNDNSSYNFANFKGTIERYSYQDILNNENKYSKKKSELLDPCLKLSNINTGSSSSGSSGGSSFNPPNPYQHSYGGIGSAGIRTFYSFQSLGSTTSITGLTTGNLTAYGTNTSGELQSYEVGCGELIIPDESGAINPTSNENDCDDTNSPINPECIGKKLDENGNCVEEDLTLLHPILGADCRSFEYSQPPNSLQKGAAVLNFNHTFVALTPTGDRRYVDSTVPIAYFTAPPLMTNSRAANLTAIAVNAAIKATDIYYATNPYASEFSVGDFFKSSLQRSMGLFGGSVSTTSPFAIRSPAPYITYILGVGNPIDC